MLRLLVISFFCLAYSACVTKSSGNNKFDILSTHKGGIYMEYNEYDDDGNLATDNKNVVKFYSDQDGMEYYLDTTKGVSLSQCISIQIEKNVQINAYEHGNLANIALSEVAKNKIMNISIAHQSANWCLFIDGKKISCHFINGILANPSISFPIYEERDINFIVAYFQKK